MFVKEDFCKRLTELRIKKGVSARDMSLSLGQSAGYIFNIESELNLPSMNMFFEICDYLGVTPSEFFAVENNSSETSQLTNKILSLSPEQLELLKGILNQMK